MEFNNPWETPGTWYKGNLHTHTTNSDGDLSPEEMVSLYKRNGYHFLAITDHSKLTRLPGENDDGFLVLTGEETPGSRTPAGRGVELVAVGIDTEIPSLFEEGGERLTPQRMIDRVRERGGAAIVAHPYFSSLDVEDLCALDGYLGIEIFNTSVDYNCGKGHSVVHWDHLLARGKRIFGFAADDAHYHFNDHRPVDTCGAWIMAKAEELTRDSIMESIRKGLFYSSNGPHIEQLSFDGGEVTVVTSGVSVVTFITDAAAGERFETGSPIASASYRLSGKERYVRVECTDEHGRSAWSNPVFYG